jgi:hypothetical protein
MDDSEPYIKYERAGIQIILRPGWTTIKKNGLTIEIPDWILRDFEVEFSKESTALNESLNKTIRGLRNEAQE